MRIGIIGHFGGGRPFCDGQTVKTVTLFEAMDRRKPEGVAIDRADTYLIRHAPLRFAGALLRCLCRDRKLVVLLSENGRRLLFPVLYVCAKVFRKEIYHYAIGGQLAREAAQQPRRRRYIGSFRANWMESRALVDALHGLGVANAAYLPNFKSLTVSDPAELVFTTREPFRFCTFSRVMPEKGVEDAIRAIAQINRESGRRLVTLDIYGPVEPGYETRFRQLVAETPDVQYCGVVDQNSSAERLRPYFALLFPTYWKGEGMPGTVIDAYCAGLPIIARRWPVCDELITHGETGLVYPQDRPEALAATIRSAIDDPARMNAMKAACLIRGASYGEEAVMRQIAEAMHVAFR